MLKLFITLLTFSASLFIPSAQATTPLERDFAQPITIDADQEFLDLKNNTYRIEGSVIIKQGSLLIHADKLVIEGFGSDSDEAERFIATGSPATYTQQVDTDVTVTAQADVITYDAGARMLILSGNAELLQSGNFLKASEITYDLQNQIISAERGKSSSQRVRTSFQPRERNNDDEKKNDSNDKGNH